MAATKRAQKDSSSKRDRKVAKEEKVAVETPRAKRGIALTVDTTGAAVPNRESRPKPGKKTAKVPPQVSGDSTPKAAAKTAGKGKKDRHLHLEPKTAEVIELAMPARPKIHISGGVNGLFDEAKRSTDVYRALKALPDINLIGPRQEAIFSRFAKETVAAAKSVKTDQNYYGRVGRATVRATNLANSLSGFFDRFMEGAPGWFDRQFDRIGRRAKGATESRREEFVAKRNALVLLLNENAEFAAIVAAYKEFYKFLRIVNNDAENMTRAKKAKERHSRDIAVAQGIEGLFEGMDLDLDDEE